MYLESFKVKNNQHFFLEEGFSISGFKNITLLVGDQGCGKSSVLSILSENKNVNINLTELGKKGVDFRYFDFEKDNPRVKDPRMFTKINGESIGMGPTGAIASRFESHGQVLSDYSVGGLGKMDSCIVFFDEPESSLSVRNQFKLIENSVGAVERDCQLIFATHCIPLIESQEEVYSMEHKMWMSSKVFLSDQKN